MVSSVFFDLDGTLADTALDLTIALNLIRQKPPDLTLEQVKPYVSLGINAMLKLALSISEDDPNFVKAKQQFLQAYQQGKHQETHVFVGMETVLEYLEKEDIIWGVVTNKLSHLAESIMQRLQLTQRASCIVGGDTTNFRKPHPQPILHACYISQCSPEKSVYIGDALTDIKAGHAAGMKTLSADYGYIPQDKNPKTWGADGNITTPKQIINWLKKENS